jgi:predicted phage-related endonuclease
MQAEFFPINIQHDIYNFFRASLDGYNSDLNKFVEIKVPTEKNFELYESGEIPEHYYIQMQWQMMVSDLPSCYFCIFNPDSQKSFVMEIERCEETQEFLKQEALIFWENLLNDIPPALSQKDYRYIEDPELKKYEEEYLRLYEEKQRLDERLKELKPHILDFGDGGNFKTDNLTVFLKNSGGAIDKKKMKEDGIDVEKYMKPGKYYYNIKVNKNKYE